MSGQLAGALDSVRFFFSRLIGVFQNSPRERTKALGGISGVSRFASHDDQFGMGAFRNAGQVFQGKCCVWEFHQPEIDALRSLAGRLNRTVD